MMTRALSGICTRSVLDGDCRGSHPYRAAHAYSDRPSATNRVQSPPLAQRQLPQLRAMTSNSMTIPERTYSCMSEIASTKCCSRSAIAFRLCERCSRMVECGRGKSELRSDVAVEEEPGKPIDACAKRCCERGQAAGSRSWKKWRRIPPNRGRGRRTPLARLVWRS
jgi:hypothetical protein